MNNTVSSLIISIFILMLIFFAPASANAACISGDCFNGQGVYKWPDGNEYSGEWKNNNRSGKGILSWANGDRYEGQWRDDNMNGYGIMRWAEGNEYAGEWKDGGMHGIGTKKWVNGNIYKGEWKNNVRSGKGVFTWSNGDRYEGEWSNDGMNGRGTMIWNGGNEYTGEWKNGRMHGAGTKKWAGGNVYAGEWQNGEQSGRGRWIPVNGNPVEGIWKDGMIVEKVQIPPELYAAQERVSLDFAKDNGVPAEIVLAKTAPPSTREEKGGSAGKAAESEKQEMMNDDDRDIKHKAKSPNPTLEKHSESPRIDQKQHPDSFEKSVPSESSDKTADDSGAKKMQVKGNRLALVIGNGAYKESPLKNPPNDARDIAQTLKELGFEVEPLIDAGQEEMEMAISRFGKNLRQGGAGLFYFAGHGIQVGGTNYLIPVDAEIESESDVKYESVDAGRVLGKMEEAGNDLNIVILDACRNNPFARSFRSADRGLARMDAPKGSMIVYATEPGSVAADGEGRNGVYTHYFLKHMTTPGLPVEQMLKKVRKDVAAETHERQIPWESSSLVGDFFFAGTGGGPSPAPDKSSISINSNVDGAWVKLDGTSIGLTPLADKLLEPGAYSLLVGRDGYVAHSQHIQVEKGRTQAFFVNLELEASKTAQLFVKTKPESARVRILNMQSDFVQGMALDPGEYPVEVSADGCQTDRQKITIRAGMNENLSVVLKCGDQEFSPPKNLSAADLGMKFVYIQPGEFMMGSPPDEPGRAAEEILHKVRLTRGFYMQTTEVTQGQWKTVMGNNPSNFQECGDDCPVEQVSWTEVQKFIQSMNQMAGTSIYRLPTEAEWEYAARAGSQAAFASGGIAGLECGNDPNLNKIGWYCGNGGQGTHPSAQKAPNEWGLYDMHGNVSEWCQDNYEEYPSGTVTDPTGPAKGTNRVLRGGGWSSGAAYCRSAVRGGFSPGGRFYSLGFRLVKTGP